MTLIADPLGRTPEPPDRVAYSVGMMLDVDDFGAEQLYHRSRLARALVSSFGSGTLAGLRVEVVAGSNGDELRVNPGLAIDRIGRLIEVPRTCCLRLDDWYLNQSPTALSDALHVDAADPAVQNVLADVFVRFVACEREPIPAFAQGPFDATDATRPGRLRDSAELRLLLRKEAAPALPAPEWTDPRVLNAAQLAEVDVLPAAEQAAKRDEIVRRNARDAVFTAWDRRESAWHGDELDPEPFHLPNQDPTSVFLARISIPAQPAAAGEPPVRTVGATVLVDNRSRRFVMPAGLLAAGLGQ